MASFVFYGIDCSRIDLVLPKRRRLPKFLPKLVPLGVVVRFRTAFELGTHVVVVVVVVFLVANLVVVVHDELAVSAADFLP